MKLSTLENLANERNMVISIKKSTSYKFNDNGGKSFNKVFNEHTLHSAELDAGAGLYYYGARKNINSNQSFSTNSMKN